MAILPIVQYPDEHLLRPSEPVSQVDQQVTKVISDLYETMYYFTHCVGLAAPQVGLNQQIAVIDVSSTRKEPLCLINPRITHREGENVLEESCMSVPAGASDNVTRAQKVIVSYWDKHGNEQTLTAEDFLARAVQHEVDHLHGKLFLHQLSRLKKQRLERRINKLQRRQAS
jgi:peptide deformylase